MVVRTTVPVLVDVEPPHLSLSSYDAEEVFEFRLEVRPRGTDDPGL